MRAAWGLGPAKARAKRLAEQATPAGAQKAAARGCV
jgi:hypothetical protein